MARLPSPGSDSGSWGDVLNDFLLQSHAADGSLQNNSVGTSQLQSNAVTSSKLAAGAVTSSALTSGSVTSSAIADGAVTQAKLAGGAGSADGLRSVLIYYATLNAINAKYDNDYAAGVLSRYDDVVLGAGLQDPGHSDYANTTAIMTKVAALNPDTVLWGYIDVGVSTNNYSLAQLQTFVDQWLAIGAGGIFCDDFGYDYGVSRDRQNSIIDYIHSKGVGAILNAWTSSDVFGSAVNATYNPSGTATHANSSDVYLLESWICNTEAYSSPYYATISDVKTRADAAKAYRDSIGIRIFAANMVGYSTRTGTEIDAFRGVAEAMARAFRLDGSSVNAASYSATGGDTAVIRPRFSLLRTNPFRKSAPYILNGPWTEVQAPDLGLIITFDPGGPTFSYTQE